VSASSATDYQKLVRNAQKIIKKKIFFFFPPYLPDTTKFSPDALEVAEFLEEGGETVVLGELEVEGLLGLAHLEVLVLETRDATLKDRE